jgi:predicted transcriptional regulator
MRDEPASTRDHDLGLLVKTVHETFLETRLLELSSKRQYQKTTSQGIYSAAHKRVVCSGGISTMSKVAEVLEMLNDGRWCGLKKIQVEAKINEAQLQQIMSFLVEYNFVVMDEKAKKVRLNRIAQEFLAQTSSA